ncbi:transglutaminase family protein [Shewanella sp. JM162201]|uniref:Transglutaminase family protein n=1 Tax=Shewanella jiangmenensis TaxID=2837387 RepID=A0ABS5V756_9GAMM|nr:DUF3488 and DUF4129 domain-containing transglutaminase family protein [Shewanella jiangmenensis]MBT1445549.1 transglutaminase family protein [Shewanella jiangmenensis]
MALLQRLKCLVGPAITDEIISRQTLLWLLLVHLALVVPLAEKTTPWALGISAICLVWRAGIFFGKVARPPRLLVTALGLASAITLMLVGREMGVLNALINLLILGYSLKTIEMLGKRDVRAVILAGYFLLSLNLLDNQGIGAMAYAIGVFGLNTLALLSLYRQKAAGSAMFAIKLVAQSLPLALLLFLVLPRLPPLWVVPHLKSSTTGLSDEVGFGDVEKLTRSDALAFRARFDGAVPANANLYWRALVLEDYDGAIWRQSEFIREYEKQAFSLGSSRRPSGEPTDSYEVIAEPSGQRWLFGLDVAYSDAKSVVNLPDQRLLALRPLDGRMQYRLGRYDAPMDLNLPALSRRVNLTLPEDSNPRTLALAKELKQQNPGAEAYLGALMARFNQDAYFYTLTPPPVGRHQIDDFLLDNKRGFCVHYASALTFMARAGGIPARMVTGYQGGEYNRDAGYLSVYQYMAHAWTEVWLEGKGWVRLDPTAQIAPSRILDGFDATFDASEAYLDGNYLSAHRLKGIPWLNELRMRLASIDYYWSLWVLGFDDNRQEQLLKRLLGSVGDTRFIVTVLIAGFALLLLIAWQAGLLKLPTPLPLPIRAFNRVEKALGKRGIARAISEGPRDYLSRAARSLPAISAMLLDFADAFEAARYRGAGPEPADLMRQSRRLVRIIGNQAKVTEPEPTASASHG